MEHFKNISENFFREIRSVEIYPSSTVTYADNFKGNFPPAESVLYIFEVVPEDFRRRIPAKKQNGNAVHAVEISFPLLRLDKSNVDKYQAYFNKRDFAVVLVSNTDKTLLGNSREPLTIEIQDNRLDDNSGNDQYMMNITGDTILTPRIKGL